jgi:hypothetical protein
MPEVLAADRVTGEDSFIVRCAIAEPAGLERVVDAMAVDGAVTTSLVLSSPVNKHATGDADRPPGCRRSSRPGRMPAAQRWALSFWFCASMRSRAASQSASLHWRSS